MQTEYEVRILEINKNEIINKLEQLGATKIGEFDQKRFLYDFNPVRENEWIRLRTNGTNTTLTCKNIEKQTIDGTKEIEIEVSDFDTTNELLEKLGYFHRGYEENKRIQYLLNGVEVDIDIWPLIPEAMEIEGKSEEEVNNMIKLLGLENEKITTENWKYIYRNVYGIDILNYKELKF